MVIGRAHWSQQGKTTRDCNGARVVGGGEESSKVATARRPEAFQSSSASSSLCDLGFLLWDLGFSFAKRRLKLKILLFYG
jgi:hypothetical protein